MNCKLLFDTWICMALIRNWCKKKRNKRIKQTNKTKTKQTNKQTKNLLCQHRFLCLTYWLTSRKMLFKKANEMWLKEFMCRTSSGSDQGQLSLSGYYHWPLLFTKTKYLHAAGSGLSRKVGRVIRAINLFLPGAYPILTGNVTCRR